MEGKQSRVLKAEIYFTNEKIARFLAKEFDIDIVGTLREQGAAGHPIKFTYKAPSGSDVPLYLVPTELAGIVIGEEGQ